MRLTGRRMTIEQLTEAKHHNEPYSDAKLTAQKRRFWGKFSFAVLPVMVRRLIRNQQVVSEELHCPVGAFGTLSAH